MGCLETGSPDDLGRSTPGANGNAPPLQNYRACRVSAVWFFPKANEPLETWRTIKDVGRKYFEDKCYSFLGNQTCIVIFFLDGSLETRYDLCTPYVYLSYSFMFVAFFFIHSRAPPPHTNSTWNKDTHFLLP